MVVNFGRGVSLTSFFYGCQVVLVEGMVLTICLLGSSIGGSAGRECTSADVKSKSRRKDSNSCPRGSLHQPSQEGDLGITRTVISNDLSPVADVGVLEVARGCYDAGWGSTKDITILEFKHKTGALNWKEGVEDVF